MAKAKRVQRQVAPRPAVENAGPTPMLGVVPAFLVVALLLYSPCFDGGFVSDDVLAVINPYGAPLSLAKVLSLFSPDGPAATMHSEYRPLWFLFHAIERHVFGDAMLGYHLTNVALHAVVSWLLALLFSRFGLPTAWAVLGGAIFLVHPGNVEAVAWISQLTSVAAMLFALSALLLVSLHPAAATGSFALALLTKPLAFFALPVAALSAYVGRSNGASRQPTPSQWLCAWLLVLLAFLAIAAIATRSMQYGVPPMHPDPVVLWRTVIANFFRYIVMAASGYGLAAFQQARPALTWLNPWWLAGVAVLALMLWRAAVMIARRRFEGVCWVWVLIGFAPVSQIVPFTHPVADRYLYFMLPGLLGGTLLLLHGWLAAVRADRRRASLRVGAALAATLLVVLSVQTYRRSAIWVSVDRLAEDSMRHYPNGLWASLHRSRLAARAGDGARAAAELRAAFEQGHREYGMIVADPVYRPVLRHPSFSRLLVDMADYWIDRVHAIDAPNQMHLYQLASAYWLRGSFAQSKKTLEHALRLGGPFDENIRQELAARFGVATASSGRSDPR